MLGLGFAIGVVEDKIENIIASKKIDSKSKDIIVDELKDMKSKFRCHSACDKRYTVKIKFGSGDKDWATYKDVIEVRAQNNCIWIQTEKKLVGYRFRDIMYFEQEAQNG